MDIVQPLAVTTLCTQTAKFLSTSSLNRIFHKSICYQLSTRNLRINSTYQLSTSYSTLKGILHSAIFILYLYPTDSILFKIILLVQCQSIFNRLSNNNNKKYIRPQKQYFKFDDGRPAGTGDNEQYTSMYY